ncbi:MAG: hypothetical protein H6934_02425 [Burkholderiaceae bacterium]|nr:hypothetical protein [Burkholderiaceae bacterium]
MLTHLFFFLISYFVLLTLIVWGVKAEIDQEKAWKLEESDEKRRQRAAGGRRGRASRSATGARMTATDAEEGKGRDARARRRDVR